MFTKEEKVEALAMVFCLNCKKTLESDRLKQIQENFRWEDIVSDKITQVILRDSLHMASVDLITEINVVAEALTKAKAAKYDFAALKNDNMA